MQCKTFTHIDETGAKVYKAKKPYNTHDEAIREAKKLNLNGKQIYKLVAYKCSECFKYHIGRGKTQITEKYRQKVAKDVKKNISFKVIGNIDLSKIK